MCPIARIFQFRQLFWNYPSQRYIVGTVFSALPAWAAACYKNGRTDASPCGRSLCERITTIIWQRYTAFTYRLLLHPHTPTPSSSSSCPFRVCCAIPFCVIANTKTYFKSFLLDNFANRIVLLLLHVVRSNHHHHHHLPLAIQIGCGGGWDWLTEWVSEWANEWVGDERTKGCFGWAGSLLKQLGSLYIHRRTEWRCCQGISPTHYTTRDQLNWHFRAKRNLFIFAVPIQMFCVDMDGKGEYWDLAQVYSV